MNDLDKVQVTNMIKQIPVKDVIDHYCTITGFLEHEIKLHSYYGLGRIDISELGVTIVISSGSLSHAMNRLATPTNSAMVDTRRVFKREWLVKAFRKWLVDEIVKQVNT